MVSLPDDSPVAGPRRVVLAHLVPGPRAPPRHGRSGPSPLDSEAWSVQLDSPRRSPPPVRSQGPMLKSRYCYPPARTPGLFYAAATCVSLH